MSMVGLSGAFYTETLSHTWKKAVCEGCIFFTNAQLLTASPLKLLQHSHNIPVVVARERTAEHTTAIHIKVTATHGAFIGVK